MTEYKTAPSDLSLFRQSRLYAEGWNAARGSLEPPENPYAEEPERAHWLRGYSEAMA